MALLPAPEATAAPAPASGAGAAALVFPGDSEMAGRCRALPRVRLAATPLGPASGWPHSLRPPTSVAVDSRAAALPHNVLCSRAGARRLSGRGDGGGAVEWGNGWPGRDAAPRQDVQLVDAVVRAQARARAVVGQSLALVAATRRLGQTLRDARVARWLDGLDREDDRAARTRARRDGPRGAGPAG